MARNFVTACVCATLLGSVSSQYAADPAPTSANTGSSKSLTLDGVTNIAELRLRGTIKRGEQILLWEGVMGLRPTPTAITSPPARTQARDLEADGKLATEKVIPRPINRITVLRVDHARQMLELSRGTDPGFHKGLTVDLYRGEVYLGRGEIIDASNDRAVVKLLASFQRATFQPGDELNGPPARLPNR